MLLFRHVRLSETTLPRAYDTMQAGTVLTNALAQENILLGADDRHLVRTLLTDPSQALQVLGTGTPTRSRGGPRCSPASAATRITGPSPGNREAAGRGAGAERRLDARPADAHTA